MRAIELTFASDDHEESPLNICLSEAAKAPDWVLDLTPRPIGLEEETGHIKSVFVAVTAHNALVEIVVEHQSTNNDIFK